MSSSTSPRREGARFTVARVSELDGLCGELPQDHAAGLVSAATSYEAWRELVHAHRLSWEEAEQTLNEALARAILGG